MLDGKIFSSQAVDEYHVYVGTTAGTMYCLNVHDGLVIWKFSTQNVCSSTPIVVGTIVYFGCLDRTVYAVNANSGTLLWKYTAEGRIKTMPVVWKNYLVILAEDRSVIAFKSSGE